MSLAPEAISLMPNRSALPPEAQADSTLTEGIGATQTAVVNRGKGIVDNIQKDLLQLAPIASDGGQAFLDVEIHSDVTVGSFLAQKSHHFFEQALQLDGLYVDVHMFGESQQPVRDGTAAFHRVEDRVDVLQELVLERYLLLAQ